MRFGDHRQRRVGEQNPLLQGRDDNPQALVALEELRPPFELLRPQTAAPQGFQQRLAPSGRFGHKEHPAVEALHELAQRRGGLLRTGVERQGGRRLGGVVHPVALQQLEVLADHPRDRLDAAEQLRDFDKELVGFERRAVGVEPGQLEALIALAPERLRRLVDPLAGEQQRLGGQIVEQGFGLGEEEREVVFDAGRRQGVAHIAVDDALLRIAFEIGAIGLAEVFDPRLIQGELPRRQQPDALDLLQGALGFGIEGPNGLHLVIEQFDAVGMTAAHGVEIDEAAADRELAMLHHLGDAAVAAALQPLAHRLQGEAVAHVQDEAAAQNVLPGRQAVHEGGQGNHQNAALEARQLIEGGQPLGDDVLIGRENVVGEGLPIGKAQHRDLLPLGGVEANLAFEPICRGRIVGHHQEHAVVPLRGHGDGQPVGAAVEASPRGPLAGSAGELRGEGREIVGVAHRVRCCRGRGFRERDAIVKSRSPRAKPSSELGRVNAYLPKSDVSP